MGLLDAVSRFVGASVYEGHVPAVGMHIRSAAVERIRELLGGNLTPPPFTQLEWYLEEIDSARTQADLGDLSRAGQLLRALRGDALVSGLLRTKAGGCVRLPKKWRGSQEIIDDLTGTDIGSIANFDLLCPQSEQQAMLEDADFLRVALGELVPVQGRPFPVLRRRDPEFLFYHWAQGRWYYRSNASLIPIDPGDGNWVLHLSGPVTAPWQFGSWLALGRTWCRKDACQHLKSNWEFTLANPARVAKSPSGATKEQRLANFQQLMGWGVNPVFGLPPGWDAAILESKGEGWQGFDSSVKAYNEEIMIAIAGQLVSITGGTGFSSEDLYASVRYDLIRDTVVPWAYTVCTQIIPAYVYTMHGEEALDDCPSFEFEVKRPDDLKAEAAVYTALGQGLKQIVDVAERQGLDVDVTAILSKFGIKSQESARSALARLNLSPGAIEQCLRRREVRAAVGVPEIGDERDDELVAAKPAADAKPANDDSADKGAAQGPGLKAVA